MTRERQAAAILALGVVAAALGFGGAAWLDGRGEPPPPPAAAASAVPAAPPEEALLQPPPPAVEPAGPRAAPAPARRPCPCRSRRRSRGRRPRPGRSRSLDRSPRRRRCPTLDPRLSLPPLPRRQVDPPAAPPAGVAIPADEVPTGYEPARRALATALASAAPGSAEEADIRRGLALWSAYLAPGAPPAPAGRRATVARALRANAWWFARRPSPGGRVLLRDPDGVILTYRGGQGFAVNPVATTGRWRGLNDDVPPEALAATLLQMGVERAAGARRFLVWEYYDVADDPDAIRPGASAMAQARVALLMAHGAARTGDPRLERAALDALASFVVLVDRGGVRTLVATAAGQDPAPWYVERAYPGESPWKGAALNGFMVTLLNLLGTAAALDRRRAAVPRGRGRHRPGARPRRPRGGDARAPPRRPRLGLLELLRPADARAPLAQLPRRPQLPLLPRAPARPAGRGLPRPRLRRDGGAVAGLRRPRRRRLPDALSG